MTLQVRDATQDDAVPLAQLINAAYRVEDFFKAGDRIDVAGVLGKMEHGRFLVLEKDGALAGCVYVEVSGPLGYFGLLSIAPDRQRQGFGGWLIRLAESACRDRGCREMEIEVVNLRAELPPYYSRFGYVEYGTRPFPDDEHTSQRCHFIVMRKQL